LRRGVGQPHRMRALLRRYQQRTAALQMLSYISWKTKQNRRLQIFLRKSL
jgi:hypothetical protein